MVIKGYVVTFCMLCRSDGAVPGHAGADGGPRRPRGAAALAEVHRRAAARRRPRRRPAPPAAGPRRHQGRTRRRQAHRQDR